MKNLNLSLLHEIANQYLHELLDIDSEFHDYSFEEGIKICIEEKNGLFKGKISNLYHSISIGRYHKNHHTP